MSDDRARVIISAKAVNQESDEQLADVIERSIAMAPGLRTEGVDITPMSEVGSDD